MRGRASSCAAVERQVRTITTCPSTGADPVHRSRRAVSPRATAPQGPRCTGTAPVPPDPAGSPLRSTVNDTQVSVT